MSTLTGSAVRTLVVYCPDWPVAALGVAPGEPAVVLVGNRVIAATPAARAEGVVAGMRRRDAQGRCPAMAVLERDVDREAHRFEPVVAAVTVFTPTVEVTRPGACLFPTRGPSRYFGGDEQLAQQVRDRVDAVLAELVGEEESPGEASGPGPGPGGGVHRWHCGVGVAEGSFAAGLAATAGVGTAVPVVVAPGDTPGWLAPRPLETLDRPAFVDVGRRLGLRTLGQLAALPVADIVARFGREGEEAHRRARGDDPRPPDLRSPPADLTVTVVLDPPVERIDQVAFAAKSLADELYDRLDRNGLACLRLAIEAESEHGETLLRLWRHEVALTAGAMAERVRWQLEGWLSSSAQGRPSGGLIRLALLPDQVVTAAGRQLRFWGGESREAERAERAVARVAALLGPDTVRVPERRGGRSAGEQFTLVPATTVALTERLPLLRSTTPWPGRLPREPARVASVDEVRPVSVYDEQGAAVLVNGRGVLSAPPARVVPAGNPGWEVTGRDVTAWAGPWPVEERWWDPSAHRRQARLQVVLDGGSAHLLVLEGGTWRIEATYD